MSKIQKQIDFFASNRSALEKDYDGKVIVIPETLEVIPFDSFEDGYNYGVANYGYGNFLLRACHHGTTPVNIISPIITLVQQ